MAALQKLLYGNPAAVVLPHLAVAHLLGLPKEHMGVLEHILKEFKRVFPAELPEHVPPDRGLGIVRGIPIKPVTEPIFRKMYRYSPR